MRALLIASVAALAFTACKKEEAKPVADAAPALTAPAKDDDAGWKQYLQAVAIQNMGTATNNPFLYYLPPESDPEFQAKYDRQVESATTTISRGVSLRQHDRLRFVGFGQDGGHDRRGVQGRAGRLDEGRARGVYRRCRRQCPRADRHPADRRRVHFRRSQ